MASPTDSISMALFCDFENVALGVRDAKYDKFDIKPVLERLLLKGSIVVKKAYCDWERYKGFKATMHEANFELIEIPHVRQSGKNSADIRLVVDALDLCYTKSHVNTFVIISGDSDFSPLVSKLRENAKQVIGVGVKQSTSDLLIANCDEFIFYDDLVRESQRAQARRQSDAAPPARRSPEEERHRKDAQELRRTQGIELAVETFDALVSERGDSGKIWASVLKEAIKRRKPDFSETYYGFRAFGNLLEEAQERGLLEFGRDEKSGAYVFRSHGNGGLSQARPDAATRPQGSYFRQDAAQTPKEPGADAPASRHRGRDGRARHVPEPMLRQAAMPEGPGTDDPTAQNASGSEPLPGSEAPTAAPLQASAADGRPWGSYFRQPAAAAEPSSSAPAPEADAVAPTETRAAAPAAPKARGRGRGRASAPPPDGTEAVAAAIAAAPAPGSMPEGAPDSSAPLTAESTPPAAAKPRKAPARARKVRTPSPDARVE